ncbi:hypothetical protein P7C73_g279, partial [Tremellales sp. Uapishka_1]
MEKSGSSSPLSSGSQSPFKSPPRATTSGYAVYETLIRRIAQESRPGLAVQLANAKRPPVPVEEESCSDDSGETTRPTSSSISAPKRLFTKKGKRKRSDYVHGSDGNVSTKWPLPLSKLPPATIGLDRAIVAFASSYIRTNKLAYPGESLPLAPDRLEEDLHLPENLVDSTKEFINQTLVNLAIVRPGVVRKKRKALDTVGWEGVMGSASLDHSNHA